MLACGAWFHASPDVHAYLTVFVNDPHDSTMVAAAALLLVAGLVLTLISALAIVGLLLRKPVFIYAVRILRHNNIVCIRSVVVSLQVSPCNFVTYLGTLMCGSKKFSYHYVLMVLSPRVLTLRK